MSEDKKKILIEDIHEHPNGGAVRVHYVMDFDEYGVKRDTISFWPGVSEEDIRYELRNIYRGELESRKTPKTKPDYKKMVDVKDLI